MVASELARMVGVVAVSPGDVQAERDRLAVVVDELNAGVARERGCRLSLWRWESDAHPGLHVEGPQGLIDEAMRIEDADLVVCIFWKRFGTPTSDAGSGTAHELRRAFLAWEQRARPQVMVYFCERKYMPKDSAEAVQLQQLLSFRETMPEQQLLWRYVTAADFERAVRKHLTAFVLALEPATPRVGGPSPKPAAAGGRRVRFGLPLAAAHFAGRYAELDAIDQALGVAERAVVTQAITGLGGVGKSQLAARYVHEHADDYDVVAWIRAEDGGIADLSELAAELGLPVAQLTPAQRAGGAVCWLSGCGERWLLVLDNVAGPEQLYDCCPSSGNGRVIVTTRDRAIAQFGPALAVDVFDEPTAVAYLLARAERREDRDGAIRLARALGFLPLALSHAGAYCAAGTSFDEYLQLLGALPAAELFDDHPEVSYTQTVASTWQVSIQAAEREAPLAPHVLAMAAYLAPDAIPRELFEVLLDDASIAPARKRLLDAFNELHQLSLAYINDATVSVHRLLQKTIRDDPAVRADKTVAISALAAVAAAFPRDLSQPQTWPLCERLLPHALAIAAALTVPGDAGPQLVTLLSGAAEYLLRADPRARAVDTATRAFASAQQILGPEHHDTLLAGAFLAGTYRYAGRTTDAIELGERLLANVERIRGSEHPNTLAPAAWLALSYWEAGRSTEAIELGERTLADSSRILGPEHPDTLTVGTILALAYVQAGRTAQATELGERVLTACERILGPERHETLLAGVTVAYSYTEAGRTTEAIELAERVLPRCVRILSPEHPDTFSAGTILARSYARAGRTGEAIELATRVLADCERTLGPQHPNTDNARGALADSYQHAGRLTEAIALWEPVLITRTRMLGTEHPCTLRARAHLAASYSEAGRTDAIELERVLADCERILGSEHPITLSARRGVTDADPKTGGASAEAEGNEQHAQRTAGLHGGEAA
jgi:tetratricopeptide (TPR) repeat protein